MHSIVLRFRTEGEDQDVVSCEAGQDNVGRECSALPRNGGQRPSSMGLTRDWPPVQVLAGPEWIRGGMPLRVVFEFQVRDLRLA